MRDIGSSNGQSIRYDSTAEGGGDELHSIQTYVSDMLALERHFAQPLQSQLAMDDTAKYGDALAAITTIHTLNGAHVTALLQCLAGLGGHETSGLKSAWASLLGMGAAAIDLARKTKVSKSLRDDYTALNLATISYTMLHATAVGLGDTTTADLAKRHLADYARCVMQIAQIIPDVVLSELADLGETVQTGAADRIRQETNEVWKSQANVTQVERGPFTQSDT